MPLTVLIMRHRLLPLAAVAALVIPCFLVACNGPRVIPIQPVLATGDMVASVDSQVLANRQRELALQGASRRAQDSIYRIATTGCAPAICAAIGRGEVALGMTREQVYAATRTAPAAWAASDNESVLTPTTADAAPRDAEGRVAFVQFSGGRVASISRESRAGLHVEASAADTTRDARTKALAAALVNEGDDFLAAGDRTRALERYDRALVLRGDDALLNYKVAQLLDQQLRPVEALMRYQKFLLQMDLQRIDALGTQNAKLAEAIALAQQRVIVLDRRNK